ncbi:MBL fold metallo-hydrolase [Mesorhizobium loti]|nr:MBL fold metallo-hydrolase [Mesorhizobium loti]PLP56036.1 MBL fold metallo-hydrolase [Mesorhizobium loti]
MGSAAIQHVRILQPAPDVYAFFDGRTENQRFADYPNWVDDGALSLGIASYALVSDDEALIYDTHISLDHAALIRSTLEAKGVRKFTVVLSHWHLDHVAGTGVFADCPVIANRRTAAHLERQKTEIEAGTLEGPPSISPLVLPTTLFEDEMTIVIGKHEVRLIEANIHSDDATVLWLPQTRLLFAGDTVEDTITYVGEPQNFAQHLVDLERLRSLRPAAILPNHGAPEVIASGGYDDTLIDATAAYIKALRRCIEQPQQRSLDLRAFIARELEAGWVHYFEPYEAVHEKNIATTLALALPSTGS